MDRVEKNPELLEPVEWRKVERSREPWSAHFGLECSEEKVSHQPHPSPWWSGSSVFAVEGQHYRQPEGPFYHAVISPNSLSDSSGKVLQPGEYLLSPAERRIEVPRIKDRFAADGCLVYKNYDVHGVYLTNRRGQASFPGGVYYEVEPEGLLWPDPERGIRDDWCCVRARVIAVHRVPEISKIN